MQGDKDIFGGMCSPVYASGLHDGREYAFWRRLLDNADDTDDRSEGSFDETFEQGPTTSTLSVKQETAIMELLQCGTWEKNDHIFDDEVGVVESPCKLFISNNDPCTAEQEMEDLYEISSESGSSNGSFGFQPDVSGSSFEDNILSDLHQEIPFLRERSEVQTASSKYKDILAAGTKNSEDEIDVPTPATTTKRKGRKKNLLQSIKAKASPRIWKRPKDDAPSKQEIQDQSDRILETRMDREARDAVDSSAFMTPISETREIESRNVESGDMSKLETFQLDEPPTKGKKKPPVAVIQPSQTEADDLIRGMSTLTTEGGDYSRYMQSNQNLIGNGRLGPSKMCMPPLLMKLKNIKLARHGSGVSRAGTTTSRTIVEKLGTIEENWDGEDVAFVYDYGSGNHSYVAFFRRGPKAAPIIRSYEHPIPPVFPTMEHEVVVRVEASTVSSTDLQIRKGDFWGENEKNSLKLPIIPGVTFAGVVTQTVNNGYRTGLKMGDRVIGLVRAGANARHISINSDQLVKVPGNIKDSCALATIPEIYSSAFQALHFGQKHGSRYRKTSLSGKCILVLGGATAVGRALIELAITGGCGTVYATGKQKQYKDIQQLGGAPLGRDPLQWFSILHGKVDLVIGLDESVGKTELQAEHMQLLTSNGKVVLLCAPDLDKDNVINLEEHTEAASTFSGRKIHMFNIFDTWEEDIKPCKRDMTHLVKLLADGSIKPKILEKIPLSKVAKAQDLMEGKKLHGFILCEPWMTGKKQKELDQEAEQEQSSTAKAWTPFSGPKPSPKALGVATDGVPSYKSPMSPRN